ncbi:MAG: TIGR00269 family protein [Promethearchaeota archaeon]|nr:MAG: TIGR00269 family protein [Candidatus Lokiarchaeota archaeon]
MMEIKRFQNVFTEGKCDYCDSNTLVLHRRYSGESLCSECFQERIEKKIYKTISKYNLLKPEDKIIVGLSGGKDSISLLYNLYKIQKRTYNSKPIIALSIDEGIQHYRANCLEAANHFCSKYNIKHHIISFKEIVGKPLDEIVKNSKQTANPRYACYYCALIRRRLLNDHAKKLGGDVLALGHNLTDIAETFLMNVLFKRFYLIANQYIFKHHSSETDKYFIKKIMPLMKIPEEEITIYANLKEFHYYKSHCPFRKTEPIVRKRVLDFIESFKQLSPEIEFNLFNGFMELSEILYNTQEKKDSDYCKKCGYPSGDNEYCSYCSFIRTLEN